MCSDIYRSGICRVRVQSNHIICGHNGVREQLERRAATMVACSGMAFISAKRSEAIGKGYHITSSISLKVWQLLLLQKLPS